MTAPRHHPPASGSWTVADAKARLSEVIERAQTDPQIITRHGKPSAVVVSAEEWARKTERKGTLAEFLLASPLRGPTSILSASATSRATSIYERPHRHQCAVGGAAAGAGAEGAGLARQAR